MHKEQQNVAMHGREAKASDADLWMEVVKKDLKVVKMMLARRALLPNFKGVEWLCGHAGILLHQVVEATAGAANKRCPAPGSTTKMYWANSAPTDVILFRKKEP